MQILNKMSTISLMILILSIFSNCGKSPTEPKEAKMELNISKIDFGSTKTEDTFIISNSGEKDLNWEISDYPDWLTINPLVGTNKDTIILTADREALDAGNYNVEIIISSNVENKTIPVSISCPLEYLNYDNDKKDSQVTVGQKNGLLWVRFSRPWDWSSCILRKVEIELQQDSTNAPFDIVYQDNYFYYQGINYPQYYSFNTLLEDCFQSTELQEWKCEKQVLNSSHFFVGIRVSSETGPFVYIDTSEPLEKRSGTNYYSQGNRIILISNINLHIRIYVTPGNPGSNSLLKNSEDEGVWIDYKSMELNGNGGSLYQKIK